MLGVSEWKIKLFCIVNGLRESPYLYSLQHKILVFRQLSGDLHFDK